MIGVSVNDTTLARLSPTRLRQAVFPKPVFVGDTLRSESECIDLRESKSRPNAGIVTWAHRSFNQRGDWCASAPLGPVAEDPRMTTLAAGVRAGGQREKIGKAIESEADAVIFDLEDSVALGQKAAARQILKDLGKRSGGPQWWVRINSLRTDEHRKDLEVLGLADLQGIVLPKAESGADVIELAHRTGSIPIHAIVTETAASLFGLLSYRDPKSPLVAMSWGAEDLSAALGASSKYDADGQLSHTYKLARCSPRRRCRRGVQRSTASRRLREKRLRRSSGSRSRGFTGHLAIHPSVRPDQCRLHPIPPGRRIFTPAIVDAFESRAVRSPFPSPRIFDRSPRQPERSRSHSIGDITCRRPAKGWAPSSRSTAEPITFERRTFAATTCDQDHPRRDLPQRPAHLRNAGAEARSCLPGTISSSLSLPSATKSPATCPANVAVGFWSTAAWSAISAWKAGKSSAARAASDLQCADYQTDDHQGGYTDISSSRQFVCKVPEAWREPRRASAVAGITITRRCGSIRSARVRRSPWSALAGLPNGLKIARHGAT